MSNIRYHSNSALTCRCIATRWGVSIAKEDDAVLKYKKLNENHIGLLQHPEHDWIGASPVGVIAGGPEDAWKYLMAVKTYMGLLATRHWR